MVKKYIINDTLYRLSSFVSVFFNRKLYQLLRKISYCGYHFLVPLGIMLDRAAVILLLIYF